MHSSPPVDIVYLWVDGNDTHWRARRLLALQRLKFTDHVDMAAYSNVEGRFRDNDELRYSLRSLEQLSGHRPADPAVVASAPRTDGHRPS